MTKAACCERPRAHVGADRLDESAPGDDRLLDRFVNQRDEAAFETLVRRHGPMVYGVCRRVLGDAHEAEDAFQATFLVLARRSRTLRAPDRLANWLYGVAYRVASKAKSKMPRKPSSQPEQVAVAAPETPAAVEWDEIRSIMDEEMSRLPEKHRAALVLCYLQGRTHAEAARELGCPEGSMSWRLAEARETFRRRLVRRGVVLSAGLLALLLLENAAPAAVPPALVLTTVEIARTAAAGGAVAGGSVSAGAAQLADAVLKDAAVRRLVPAAVLALILLLTAVVGGVSTAASGSEDTDAGWAKWLRFWSSGSAERSGGGCGTTPCGEASAGATETAPSAEACASGSPCGASESCAPGGDVAAAGAESGP